ncbi:uncharacterized protein BcabD6B2_23920 [Babesia caballi]|uniref:Uncharacterized protein n=1 Tax=Babesia caballi TaxID=5871 RepID=A0AAV4LT65_BABCB|nr:hypothetical protein BcabD6B2_23920 [Babesia caballi]
MLQAPLVHAFPKRAQGHHLEVRLLQVDEVPLVEVDDAGVRGEEGLALLLANDVRRVVPLLPEDLYVGDLQRHREHHEVGVEPVDQVRLLARAPARLVHLPDALENLVLTLAGNGAAAVHDEALAEEPLHGLERQPVGDLAVHDLHEVRSGRNVVRVERDVVVGIERQPFCNVLLPVLAADGAAYFRLRWVSAAGWGAPTS